MPLSHRVLAIALALAVTALCLVLSSPRRPGVPALLLAGLVVAGSAGWLSLKEAYEGPTVVDAGGGHGIAAADLGVPPALAVAGAVVLRWLRQRP